MPTLSEQITSTREGQKVWHQERVIFETTERICELMEGNDVSRTELARRLKKSKGYITQLLDGTSNMTLRTLSDVYLALGRAYQSTDGPLSVSNVQPMVFRVYDDTVDWDDWGRTEEDSPAELPDTDTPHKIDQSVA
jgi:transcriptional regulator with XRE-family HTH domain